MTMRVCLLVFWSIWAPPFEGGQYVTCKRCERAGPIQAVHLSRLYGGPLHWKCKDMML